MKYILTASIFALALVGCTDKKSDTQAPAVQESTSAVSNNIENTTASVENTADANQTINFTGPLDLTIILTTTDNFETAQLADNSDKTYALKQVVSGSGIKLANDDGVSIHFKNVNGVQEGVVELVKGNPIEIKEFK